MSIALREPRVRPVRLYERAGMRAVRCNDVSEKALRRPGELGPKGAA